MAKDDDPLYKSITHGFLVGNTTRWGQHFSNDKPSERDAKEILAPSDGRRSGRRRG
jgi:hypothetical protein